MSDGRGQRTDLASHFRRSFFLDLLQLSHQFRLVVAAVGVLFILVLTTASSQLTDSNYSRGSMLK